ncbi:MAG: hypothetical protein OIF48_05155 [Silicimonas sp.]|nr:hypothetical protein [Silicimonas sp.]
MMGSAQGAAENCPKITIVKRVGAQSDRRHSLALFRTFFCLYALFASLLFTVTAAGESNAPYGFATIGILEKENMSETILVDSDFQYNQFRINGNDADVIDASDGSWIVDNHGALKNIYPFFVDGSVPGLKILGGNIEGQVPLDIDWLKAYVNSAAVMVRDAPDVELYNWSIDQAWDGIRIAANSDGFLIDNVMMTNIRDDAIENDYGAGGTISNSMFDGVFSGLSMTKKALPNMSSKTVTIDNVMMRMESYLFRGEMTHQSPFKIESNSPSLEIHNTVIAIDDVDHIGQSRTEQAWNKTIDASNNYFLNLSDRPLPDDYPLPGDGWTVLEGHAARDHWDASKTLWLEENSAVHEDDTKLDDAPVQDQPPEVQAPEDPTPPPVSPPEEEGTAAPAEAETQAVQVEPQQSNDAPQAEPPAVEDIPPVPMEEVAPVEAEVPPAPANDAEPTPVTVETPVEDSSEADEPDVGDLLVTAANDPVEEEPLIDGAGAIDLFESDGEGDDPFFLLQPEEIDLAQDTPEPLVGTTENSPDPLPNTTSPGDANVDPNFFADGMPEEPGATAVAPEPEESKSFIAQILDAILGIFGLDKDDDSPRVAAVSEEVETGLIAGQDVETLLDSLALLNGPAEANNAVEIGDEDPVPLL